jgi:hypothetical protein
MADNFGLKIGVEGEKEFKKALSNINQSFKVAEVICQRLHQIICCNLR